MRIKKRKNKQMKQGHVVYSQSYRRLHWFMAGSIIALLVAGQQFNFNLSVSERVAGLFAHSTLGSLMLIAVGLLLTKRFIRRDPVPKPSMPLIKIIAARGVQYGLYTLAVLIPLTGLGAALYSPHPVYFLNVIDISLLDATQVSAFNNIRSMHMWATRGAMLLLAAHAGAALYHHFIVKDAVLKSMAVLDPRLSRILLKIRHRQ